jgi:hypothetical protein
MEMEQMMELLKSIKNYEPQPDKDGRWPRRNASRSETKGTHINQASQDWG